MATQSHSALRKLAADKVTTLKQEPTAHPAWRIALAAAMFCTSVPVLAMAQTASDAARGKTLFNANCAVCHLASGIGGVKFGNVASADLRAPGLEQTYNNSDQLILRAILHARDQDNAPLNPPMPAWSGRLTTTQAKDIIAYLHKLHS